MKRSMKLLAASGGIILATASSAFTAQQALAAEISDEGSSESAKISVEQAPSSAPQTKDEAKAVLGEKQEQASQVEQAVDDAKDAVADAAEGVAAAESERQAAEESSEQADRDAAAAFDQAKIDAANAVTDAEADLDRANANEQAAKEAVADATSDLRNAAAAKKTAADEFDAAMQADKSGDYSSAPSDLRDAAAAVSDAEASVSKKQAERDNAQDAYDSAQGRVSELEQARDKAQEELDAVTPEGTGITNAKEFYEWLGGNDAYEAERFDWDTSVVPAHNEYLLREFTNQGADGDATSVENIKKIFAYLRECNELRRAAGVDELLITTSLMFEAQVGVNWSDASYAHNNMYSNSENLAWTYGNPYRLWYDKEYKLYQSYLEQYPDMVGMTSEEIANKYMSLWVNIGHYLNIVNPKYKYTGFAFTNEKVPTYDQTFKANNYGLAYLTSTGGGAWAPMTGYTVDEYEALFLEALEGPRLTDEQRAAKAEKKAVLEAVETTLSEAVKQRDQAQATLDAIEEELSRLQDLLESKKVAYRGNIVQKEQAFLNACNKSTEVTKIRNQAEAALVSAKSAVEEAEAALAEVKDADAVAQSLTYRGSDTAPISDSRFSWLNGKIAAVADAEEALATAVEKEEQAKAILSEKQAVLDEAQDAYVEALAELAIAQDDYNMFEKAEDDVPGETGGSGASEKDDGNASSSSAISLVGAKVSGIVAKTYNGKKQTQQPVVKIGATVLKAGTDYKVSFKDNTNAGTATYTITGIGKYSGTAAGTFAINKAANTVSVKAKKGAKAVKAKTVKKKAVAVKGLAKAVNAKGAVKYSNASKAKAAKKFKVNAKTGAVKVAKGTKKGIYKVKVKIVATGNANYAATAKYATVKIRVK